MDWLTDGGINSVQGISTQSRKLAFDPQVVQNNPMESKRPDIYFVIYILPYRKISRQLSIQTNPIHRTA